MNRETGTSILGYLLAFGSLAGIVVAVVACSLVVDFDRSRIPDGDADADHEMDGDFDGDEEADVEVEPECDEIDDDRCVDDNPCTDDYCNVDEGV